MTVKTIKPDLLIDHGDGRKVTYPLGASVDLDEARARSLIERGLAELPGAAPAEPAPERPARA
jgi:hypothetical protein